MLDRFWDKENRYTKGVLKEYKHWVTEVSYSQHTLGCYIIFSKRPVEKISKLDSYEITELGHVMSEIEDALSSNDKFNPDRFNYWQMGNSLHHLHFHGIPRYSSPREFDGKTWVDRSWGHVPIWSNNEVSHELVEKIRDSIRENIY